MLLLKPFLILVLVTTQLLAGSCGSLYVCICNDGACYCVDTGPESCTCCHDDAGNELHHDDGYSGRSHEICNCKHDLEISPRPAEGALLAFDPCGCTHILIAVERPTSVTRTLAMGEAERLTQFVALLPVAVFWNETVTLPSLNASLHGPPDTPGFALTIISTTVMRC